MDYATYGDSTFQTTGMEGNYGTPSGVGALGDSPSKRQYTNDPCIHVTAKMLKESTFNEAENHYLIEDQAVRSVQLIGIIYRSQQTENNVSYQVFDGSGLVTVRDFNVMNSPNTMENYTSPLKEGDYINVVGSIRKTDQDILINAIHIQPLEEINQFYHHLLCILQNHIYHIHTGTIKPQNSNYDYEDLKSSSLPSGYSTRYIQQVTNQFGNLDQSILQIFQSYRNQGTESVSIDMFVETLHSNGISEQEIRESISRLEDAAAIYSAGGDFYSLT